MEIHYQLWKLALLISGTGAFGGIVSAIIIRDRHHISCFDDESPQTRSIKDDIGFFIGRILMGVAGGWTITCFGIWAKFLNEIVNTGDLLFLSGLCVLVGSFSDRILAGMATRLENEMGIINEKVGVAKSTAETAVETAIISAAETMDYSAAISAADSALRPDSSLEDVERSIGFLKNIVPRFPKDRTLHVMLGRLYKKNKNYDDAIRILREFIRNLHRDSSTPSGGSIPDCGVAYYNIACYLALLAANESGDEKIRLEKEAMDALESGIQKLVTCKKYALGDNDFKGMKENPIFKKLTGDAGTG